LKEDHIKKILSFAAADEGMIIEPDIDLYRELKLRLLNGTHTLSCGIAFLAGLDTVKHAMDDKIMGEYIADLMRNEIGTSIPYKIDSDTVQSFIRKVLDRFRNPHINHYWRAITLNYSSKMKLRCIPLLVNYYKKNDSAPELLALGFASYIYFIKAVKQSGNEFFGEVNGEFYLIEDNMAETFYRLWQNFPVEKLVEEVLKNTDLWEEDINVLQGFQQSVIDKLNSIIDKGMKATLKSIIQINQQGL
jgi:tagaturonate reductase